MGATFVHEGVYIDYTPGSDVAAGDIIDLGAGKVGIATAEIKAGALGALAVKGVFAITKSAAGDTAAQGAQVTITAGAGAAGVVDVTTPGNHFIVEEAVATGQTEVRVHINRAFS